MGTDSLMRFKKSKLYKMYTNKEPLPVEWGQTESLEDPTVSLLTRSAAPPFFGVVATETAAVMFLCLACSRPSMAAASDPVTPEPSSPVHFASPSSSDRRAAQSSPANERILMVRRQQFV